MEKGVSQPTLPTLSQQRISTGQISQQPSSKQDCIMYIPSLWTFTII